MPDAIGRRLTPIASESYHSTTSGRIRLRQRTPMTRRRTTNGNVFPARFGADRRNQRQVGMNRLHTVSVTVDDASADREEMTPILRAGLADFDLRLSHDDYGRTVLTLTVEAADLWLAVLIAMHAVTATGYRPTALTAGPDTGPNPDRGR